MIPSELIGFAIAIFLAFFTGLQINTRKPEEPPTPITVIHGPPEPQKPPVEPVPAPIKETVPATVPESEKLSWADPQGAYKLTRMMCDEMGLPILKDIAVYGASKILIGRFAAKDIIAACIYQESQFMNRHPDGRPVKFENKQNGVVWSTDWGICQINDTKGWHIGPGLAFSSVQDVLDHPEKAVRYMIRMYLAGKISLWSSYKTGAYKQHLLPTSRMWKLRS